MSSTHPTVIQVNAFTATRGAPGGNPAGVVLDADAMTETQMQALAAQVGLSETVFVSRSQIADFRLDFFTPTTRINDCGHATVAAFTVLSEHDPGLRFSSKEIYGGQRREITLVDGRVTMEQPLPLIQELDTADVTLLSLSFNRSEPKRAWHARHDAPYLILELASVAELAAFQPDQAAILSYSHTHRLVGVYAFSSTGEDSPAFTARMFAPAHGIPEEPATGMAAGLLAAVRHQATGQSEFVIEQGRWMPAPSPSLLIASVRNAEGRVLVGGYATARAVSDGSGGAR